MNEEKSIVVPASEIKSEEQYTVSGSTITQGEEIVIGAPTFPDKTVTV